MALKRNETAFSNAVLEIKLYDMVKPSGCPSQLFPGGANNKKVNGETQNKIKRMLPIFSK